MSPPILRSIVAQRYKNGRERLAASFRSFSSMLRGENGEKSTVFFIRRGTLFGLGYFIGYQGYKLCEDEEAKGKKEPKGGRSK